MQAALFNAMLPREFAHALGKGLLDGDVAGFAAYDGVPLSVWGNVVVQFVDR